MEDGELCIAEPRPLAPRLTISVTVRVAELLLRYLPIEQAERWIWDHNLDARQSVQGEDVHPHAPSDPDPEVKVKQNEDADMDMTRSPSIPSVAPPSPTSLAPLAAESGSTTPPLAEPSKPPSPPAAPSLPLPPTPSASEPSHKLREDFFLFIDVTRQTTEATFRSFSTRTSHKSQSAPSSRYKHLGASMSMST